MELEEIQEYGRMLGILSLNRFRSREEVISLIQLEEEGKECFGCFTFCPEKKCVWYAECKDYCRRLSAKGRLV